MEKFLYFFVHLGVPILIIWSLWTAHSKSKVGFLIGKIFQIACLLFLFQWGQYPLVGSYYIRFFLLVIILFVAIVGWGKWRTELSLFPKVWNNIVIFGLLIVATPFLLYMNIRVFAGSNSNIEPVGNLNFPLKNGTYYVSSGGTTAIVNNHFRTYPNSQQYAIDINQINRLGSVSSNILSNSSEDHLIYGQDVYCPCSGVVKEIKNDVPDNITTNMTVNHEFGRGNYIELECEKMVVSIYHLKKGSVLVNSGDLVMKEQLLGKVGNSGFSLEPHLHIQAAHYNEDSTLVGVPVKFDNRWLVRNALVD